MKWKTLIYSIIVSITIFCKPPVIDKNNYPLVASLFNSATAGLTVIYPSNDLFFELSQPSSIVPTTTGTISSCTANPALPSGLTISNTTCIISGIPTTQVSPYLVTVTASDSETSITIDLIITVSAAPGLLSYPGPQTFLRGTDIGVISPSVTGIVTSYSISPALPSGLFFDTQTGVITGTPTVLSPSTNYLINASNPAGSSSISLNITVNEPPPTSVSYSGSPFTFTEFQTITVITPSLVGGSITSCTAAPALPSGLTIEPTTCKILGTPTSLQSNITHTITATNASGSVTTDIIITVNTSPNKKIFVTQSGYLPLINFATPALADSLCNSDPGKPAGGTYKAMVVASLSRVACTSSNCGGSGNAEHIDWIFLPSTTYYQNDGLTPIFTTNALALPPNTFTNSVNPSHSKYWTGLMPDWTVSLNNCTGWTLSIGNSNCGGSSPNNTVGGFTDSWGPVTCSAAQQLLCVQQ